MTHLVAGVKCHFRCLDEGWTSLRELPAAGAWATRSCHESSPASGVKGRPGPRGTIASPPVA